MYIISFMHIWVYQANQPVFTWLVLLAHIRVVISAITSSLFVLCSWFYSCQLLNSVIAMVINQFLCYLWLNRYGFNIVLTWKLPCVILTMCNATCCKLSSKESLVLKILCFYIINTPYSSVKMLLYFMPRNRYIFIYI